jgi:hypothetical protein
MKRRIGFGPINDDEDVANTNNGGWGDVIPEEIQSFPIEVDEDWFEDD